MSDATFFNNAIVKVNIIHILKMNGVEDWRDCLMWAFGYNFDIVDVKEWIQLWNTRHGNLLMMKFKETVNEGLRKVCEEYKRSECGKWKQSFTR